MSYASVADLRDEGVTEAMASEPRLTSLLAEVSQRIDRLTGHFFSPRSMTFRLPGRGSATLELPHPPLRIDRVRVAYAVSYPAFDLSVERSMVVLGGAPVSTRYEGARIRLMPGYAFPVGDGNVEVTGLFGYTEDDGTPMGRTPLDVRRATMLLVSRALIPIGDPLAREEQRRRARVIEERTRDQSVRYGNAPGAQDVSWTGDIDADQLLAPFVRPPILGAA